MFTEKDNALHAEFRFANFRQAFAFMTDVAIQADKLGHHPEWSNLWNTVRIRLCTHDARNTITDLDRQLAAAIEIIYQKIKH
mgnify:FL=1